MPSIIEGTKQARGLKLGIIVSRYNQFITEKLLGGALDAFTTNGGDHEDLTVVHVPGAFEIPIVADKMAASGRFDGLVCLGAVIRGDTPHFDYVCDAVTAGIGETVRTYKLPIGFGVLTTNDVQQAMDRAGTKDANKGYEALSTVLEMISVIRQLS
jgi:6,7-dimethyl-8-ribityllumazine synthase